MTQLVELHRLIPPAHASDTVIAGISPDAAGKMNDVIADVRERSDRPFAITLLSDADHKVMDQYGLRNMEAARLGRYLPHPTTYVIDPKGVVRWKFTEVNYRIRPTNEMILAELKKLWK